MINGDRYGAKIRWLSFLFGRYFNYGNLIHERYVYSHTNSDFLPFRKHGISAGPGSVLSTQPDIKNEITNFHREKLPSCNTSDVSSPVYGDEKVGRVSQCGRRYLHVAYVSIRLLCGTFDVGHWRAAIAKNSATLTHVPQNDIIVFSFDHITIRQLRIYETRSNYILSIN